VLLRELLLTLLLEWRPLLLLPEERGKNWDDEEGREDDNSPTGEEAGGRRGLLS